MKLSLCQAHIIYNEPMMPYNMHGMVAALLNLARKERFPFSTSTRIEAVYQLRVEGLLRIHGGHIVFLPSQDEYDLLFSDTKLISENTSFYCGMSSRGGDTVISWNHVLLLIKASYTAPEKRDRDSGIRLKSNL